MPSFGSGTCFEFNFNPTVGTSPLSGCIGQDRVLRCHPEGFDLHRVDSLADQIAFNDIGPEFRKTLIVTHTPDRIGVAFDDDVGVRKIGNDSDKPAEQGIPFI